MKASIKNYRMARHHFTGNQMVIYPEGTDNREKAQKLVGKTVEYDTGKKVMKGKITSAHGNKGAVRVLFESGMPGQAISKSVKII